ncbi:MAG: L-arabinose ABC transporter ATP-binding protein AraG [Fimbriimonadaceae bacterium]
MPTQPSLAFDRITMTFPGVRALDDVSFSVRAGSVHALLGENGAGKSTLLKVLSGVNVPASGDVRLDGRPVRLDPPINAIRAGVAVIYQELHLAPDMSVAENVLLGHMPSRGGWLDRRRLVSQAKAWLDRVGLGCDPETRLGDLSPAHRQMVEIAKALSRDARVIAFDEPTSSLSAAETDRLFAIIRALRDEGRTVLYVSHRLAEIFEIADAATVLRDGKHIETFSNLAGTTADTLVNRMVGREIEDIFGYRMRPTLGPGLVLENIRPRPGDPALNLEVRRGEIVGIFGLVGSGRTELLRSILRSGRDRQARVSVFGEAVRLKSPADAIAAGIVLCPEDRQHEALIPIQDVAENINLSARRRFANSFGFRDLRRERANALAQIDRLRIRPPDPGRPVDRLSGGNQQKVVLARWLSEEVRVLLLDEPTRGIDVGAKREIYEIVFGLAERGIAVLLVSSELPEVVGICDRVLVMRDATIAREFSRSEATPESVLAAALPPPSDGRLAP